MNNIDIIEECCTQLSDLARNALSGVDSMYYYSTDVLRHRAIEKDREFVGVVYMGSKSVNPEGPAMASVIASFGILVVYGNITRDVESREDKSIVTGYLKSIRDAIRDQRVSPSGNPWRFQGEAPFDIHAGKLVYMQHWMTKATIL